MRSWTQNFSLGLVGLTADHDASRGSPSGLPGGPCASSVIILPLDPHLVDASVNFEDLGYLQSFKIHIWCVPQLNFILRLSSTFICVV